MLDDLIATRTGAQAHSRRIARAVQRLARFIVIPASFLMLGGLIAFGAREGLAGDPTGPAVIEPGALLSRATLSPLGAMSAGLLALALLPVAIVVYILADSLAHRRWSDAGAAAAVAAILVLGIILGRA